MRLMLPFSIPISNKNWKKVTDKVTSEIANARCGVYEHYRPMNYVINKLKKVGFTNIKIELDPKKNANFYVITGRKK